MKTGKVHSIAVIAAAICVGLTPVAYAGQMAHYWSKGWGDYGNDVGRSVAVDGAGNVVVVGSFEGTINLGGSDLSSVGDEDIFIAKFNQYGTHVWSMSFGDSGGDQAVDVAVDSAGSIYVTGYFDGTIDMGGGSLITNGGRDIFLAKFSSAGAHMWSASYGSSFGNDEGRSVAIDYGGNVIMAGEFGNTVDFGGGNRVSNGNADVFIAKYNTFGTHLYSTSFGGTGWEEVGEVGTSPHSSAAVYVIGDFEGSVDFGGGALVSAGATDVFVARYSSTLAFGCAERYGDVDTDYGEGIAVGTSDVLFITGSFRGQIDFGGGALAEIGGTTSFVASLNSSCGHRWSRANGQSHGWNVALNPDGEVFVTGLLLGTGDFGGGDLVSAGGYDVFVAWYEPSFGNHIWSQRYGDAGNDAALGIAVDYNGHPTITGETDGTINFGGYTLGGAGNFDLFVAKFFGEIEIGALDDCDQDRGRCALMLWYKHFLDGPPIPVDPPLPPVVRYSVYRAVGTLPMYPPDPICPGPSAGAVQSINPCNFWTRVAVVLATGNEQYSVEVPTTADAPVMHYFAVIAEDDEGGYHVSDVDSIASTNELGSSITSVIDVPDDEGRRVNITFTRDSEDTTGATTPILSYEVYREDASAPAGAVGGNDGDTPHRIDGWTWVATTPAHGDDVYSIEAPTVGDSTVSKGSYNSTFFVRAATGTPSIFYDSGEAAGYSLDNLAPSAPTGFVNNAGTLSWDPSPAADFDYFTVYGADSNDFGTAVVVDYASGETMDVTGSPYALYFVTATDESGNEGPPASLYSPTGTGTPDRYVLSVTNYPNPFNPSTTIRYTVPSPGNVTVAIFDSRGARVATLVDNESYTAGAHSLTWNGLDDAGNSIASGVYFARIEHNGAARTRKMLLVK